MNTKRAVPAKTQPKPDTIKLTHGQMLVMAKSPLLESARSKRIRPVKAAYWLSRAVNRIIQEINSREFVEARQAIIDLYAKKKDGKPATKPGPHGQTVVDFGANDQQANKEMSELQSIEIDLGINPIQIDFEDSDLTSVEFDVLMPLLLEPAE